MPIVFVHGVATRRDPRNPKEYDRRVAARTALIRRFLAPALGLDPRAVRVLNPYWGDNAARFRWQGASLTTRAERFGPSDLALELLAETVLETGTDAVPPDRMLADIARQSPDAAVDLLWSAAASVEWAGDDDFERLAAWAQHSAAWADGVERAGLDDDLALINALTETTVDPATERFGGGDATMFLREGLSRIQGTGSRLAARAAAALLRQRVQEEAATFMGDVLTYLRQREEYGRDAPIAVTVAHDLAEAAQARTAADPHVVLVAHSMGGNIVFDLLSNLRTELSCDVLVTVGSQVGLFAELGLLPAVADPETAGDRQPRPANIGRWINVFDACDVLSFATAGIFDGTEDFVYSTGRGAVRSHSAYFLRPSFFRRLARHLGGAR